MIAKAILIKNYFVSLKEKRPPLRPNSFWGDQRYQRCHSKYVLCVWCMHEQTKTNHRIAWKTSLYMYTNGSTVWFTSSSSKSILFLHGGCLVFMYCTQSAFIQTYFVHLLVTSSMRPLPSVYVCIPSSMSGVHVLHLKSDLTPSTYYFRYTVWLNVCIFPCSSSSIIIIMMHHQWNGCFAKW